MNYASLEPGVDITVLMVYNGTFSHINSISLYISREDKSMVLNYGLASASGSGIRQYQLTGAGGVKIRDGVSSYKWGERDSSTENTNDSGPGSRLNLVIPFSLYD